VYTFWELKLKVIKCLESIRLTVLFITFLIPMFSSSLRSPNGNFVVNQPILVWFLVLFLVVNRIRTHSLRLLTPNTAILVRIIQIHTNFGCLKWSITKNFLKKKLNFVKEAGFFFTYFSDYGRWKATTND
jgi:hypothetical protein